MNNEEVVNEGTLDAPFQDLEQTEEQVVQEAVAEPVQLEIPGTEVSGGSELVESLFVSKTKDLVTVLQDCFVKGKALGRSSTENSNACKHIEEAIKSFLMDARL